jgi:hypothetical protein
MGCNRFVVLVVIGMTFACGRWETVTFVDEGDLCFEQRGPSVAVSVTAPDCLSSSCSRDLDGSCTSQLDGTTIVLTSEISWEDDEAKFAQCTSDCGAPTIECDLGELPDGTYTVVHGEEQVSLVVPVTEACAI